MWQIIMLFKTVLLLGVFAFVLGDVNMQNPRGCNNRFDESTQNRENANRLFDSENNGYGGHNVGEERAAMTYISGTTLKIEWANQHSCGDQNNNCEIVLQYMCGENVRDGETTSTVPRNPTQCADNNCDTDPKYGHHESWRHYGECLNRERNKGIFNAGLKLGGDSAIFTRQSQNEDRYGYECPEERDYYPYWRSSPWIDIAVMTNDTSKCDEYIQESQNTMERWECKFPDEFWDGNPLEEEGNLPYPSMNQEECESSIMIRGEDIYNGIWTKVEAHGVPSPECLKTQWSRDNHQGNTLGGEFLSYNWELPSVDSVQKCVVRIRYNVSTNDFPTDIDSEESRKNLIYPQFGMSRSEGIARHYFLRNNPTVDIFNTEKNFTLRLAINRAQYGRTFQDRSHVFQIAPVPEEHIGHKIHNINVRGKRGNIVQTYPSVEYDFVPNNLTVQVGECVQFQWTGSDTNNQNANGQGEAQTDRSNVASLRERNFGVPIDFAFSTNYPKSDFSFLGLEKSETYNLACLGDCDTLTSGTLDDRSSYFNSGPLCLTTPGTFYYMSTRNNAFTNRDQKGVIHVLQ